MAKVMVSAIAPVVAFAAACIGCTGDDPCERERERVDPDGDRYGYVVHLIDLPGTNNEARALGLDIYEEADDLTPTVENAFGQVVAAVGQLGEYDLDRETNLLIEAGAILHLLELQTTSLVDADEVGLRVMHALDTDGDPTDNFSGTEAFGLDAGRGEGLVTGTITDGHLVVRLGTAPIAVTFPGLEEPFVLPLIGARFDAWVTPDGLVGRLGGAIPEEHVDGTLLPVLHEGLSRVITRDCPGGTCTDGSFGEILLQVFDADHDGTMTLAELRANSLTISLLTPDVDLRNGTLAYEPGCDDRDGTSDSLSIGVGFNAVRAQF